MALGTTITVCSNRGVDRKREGGRGHGSGVHGTTSFLKNEKKHAESE